MNMNEAAKMRNVWIDAGHLENMITGIADLSFRLWHAVYSETPKGILNKYPELNEGQNAIDFVNQYSELTGAALKLIGSTAGIISDLFTNEDAAIVFTEDIKTKED